MARAAHAAAGARARRRPRTRRDRHASVEPLAGPAHHRHAALPPERRAAPLRRLAQQHLRAARPRRHRGRRPRDRRARRAAQLPAGAARALGELAVRRGVNSGLHSARTEIFTRMFPRCGIPDAYGGWHGFDDYVAFLYRTGSITEHTQIWWSVRPHLAYPTIEIRICDAQPDLARGAVARRRSATRSPRAGARASTRASRCPTCRTGCSRRTCGARSATGCPASCSTSSAASRSRRARGSSSSSSGSQPVAEEIGAAPYPRRAASRTPPSGRSRRLEEGCDARGDLCGAGSEAGAAG